MTARRIFVLGATGTVGRATVRALVRRGHAVTCLVRPRAGPRGILDPEATALLLPGATLRFGDALDPVALRRDGFRGEKFDALLSCMASRTGAPRDAWAVDHAAHCVALAAARDAGVRQIVQLSAICVQKPRLAFQHAKLAFEKTLIDSGLTYSIVRPTALFKSLSGQVARVRRGKPFLVFGDGTLTACKPIGDDDLGDYLAGCLDDPARHNRILPIGGPGEPVTPLAQAAHLFALLGQPMRVRRVPLALLDGIVAALGAAGSIVPALSAKAELARIGRYYATESMLVWDEKAQRYDPEATPSTGSETLFDHYAALVRGKCEVALGDHAVF